MTATRNIIGLLPEPARARLIAASKVPGSLQRRIAIENAERWALENYPEFFRKDLKS